MPDDPKLREALRRAAPDLEVIRLALAIARLAGHPNDGTRVPTWWVRIAVNAKEKGWTVDDLRAALAAIKQHTDLDKRRLVIASLARATQHPRTFYQLRDYSGGFLLPYTCPRCEFEFGPVLTPGGPGATLAEVEKLIPAIQRAIAIYRDRDPQPLSPVARQDTAFAWAYLKKALQHLTLPAALAGGRGRGEPAKKALDTRVRAP